MGGMGKGWMGSGVVTQWTCRGWLVGPQTDSKTGRERVTHRQVDD